jgi:hypothetical protein
VLEKSFPGSASATSTLPTGVSFTGRVGSVHVSRLDGETRRSCDRALAWWRDNRQSGRAALNVPSSPEVLDSWNQEVGRLGATTRIAQEPSGWKSAKEVAEAVMDDYQARAERVRAAVIVLAVEGMWSNIPQPGILLCPKRRSPTALSMRPNFGVRLSRDCPERRSPRVAESLPPRCQCVTHTRWSGMLSRPGAALLVGVAIGQNLGRNWPS